MEELGQFQPWNIFKYIWQGILLSIVVYLLFCTQSHKSFDELRVMKGKNPLRFYKWIGTRTAINIIAVMAMFIQIKQVAAQCVSVEKDFSICQLECKNQTLKDRGRTYKLQYFRDSDCQKAVVVMFSMRICNDWWCDHDPLPNSVAASKLAGEVIQSSGAIAGTAQYWAKNENVGKLKCYGIWPFSFKGTNMYRQSKNIHYHNFTYIEGEFCYVSERATFNKKQVTTRVDYQESRYEHGYFNSSTTHEIMIMGPGGQSPFGTAMIREKLQPELYKDVQKLKNHPELSHDLDNSKFSDYLWTSAKRPPYPGDRICQTQSSPLIRFDRPATRCQIYLEGDLKADVEIPECKYGQYFTTYGTDKVYLMSEKTCKFKGPDGIKLDTVPKLKPDSLVVNLNPDCTFRSGFLSLSEHSEIVSLGQRLQSSRKKKKTGCVETTYASKDWDQDSNGPVSSVNLEHSDEKAEKITFIHIVLSIIFFTREGISIVINMIDLYKYRKQEYQQAHRDSNLSDVEKSQNPLNGGTVSIELDLQNTPVAHEPVNEENNETKNESKKKKKKHEKDKKKGDNVAIMQYPEGSSQRRLKGGETPRNEKHQSSKVKDDQNESETEQSDSSSQNGD